MNQSTLGSAKPLPKSKKDELVESVRQRVANENEVLVDHSGGCVYYAHYTMEVLAEAGLRPCIQGGTMCWPRVTEEQDDGVSSTHFSYVWEPNHKNSRFAAVFGRLPELHVWVGLPDTQELVDLTVRNFPKACLQVLGEPWLGPHPPDYLWQSEPPERVVYEANEAATFYALCRIWLTYRPRYLEFLKDELEQFAKQWGLRA